MTEQTGKVAQLTPEEWKQLVLLNTAQLQNYLQGIPGNTEAGASGLTDQHMALIAAHMDRGRSFLRAWSLSKMTLPVAPQPAQVAATNGAAAPDAAPKRKGGWPAGKPRKPKEAAAA